MSLNDSFQKAERVNREQELLLKEEIYRDMMVVNRMIAEIMWGESKNNMLFDLAKEYNVTTNEFDLFYKQALQCIKENRKWYKR